MSDRWVAVLSGGLSHERDVSLRSGRRLSAALRSVGLTVDEWDTDSGLLERLRANRPDAVVVALHGGQGENGSIQSILEMFGVPYVGTDSRACRWAWDRPNAKAELEGLARLTLLPEAKYRDLNLKYGEVFRAAIGAEWQRFSNALGLILGTD